MNDVPEGAMWYHRDSGLFYRWIDGSAFVDNPPSHGWVRSIAGWRREQFDDRDKFDVVAAEPAYFAQKIVSREQFERDYAQPSDRAGIAAASKPAPLPDFTFELFREHEPRDGLTVVASLGSLRWGAQ